MKLGRLSHAYSCRSGASKKGQRRAYVSLCNCSDSPSICTLWFRVSLQEGSGGRGKQVAAVPWSRQRQNETWSCRQRDRKQAAILVQFHEDKTGTNNLKTFSNMSTRAGAKAFSQERTKLLCGEIRTKRSIGCLQT